MISGVILTHNEERNIVECIRCLRPHVAEILLVDTESTDRTVELAQPLVDKVLPHPHVANFDSARNIAIPESRFDWMWFVDADEFIPEATGKLVNQLVRNQGGQFEILNIPFKSHFCGQWMRYCGWWPGYTSPRVMKRGFFEFSRALHGGVQHQGREVRVNPDPDLGIPHYSYENMEHYLEKLNRYTSTEASQLRERGFDWNWRTALSGMVHDLWQHYEFNRAKLDGDRGWILTWLSAQYRWLSIAKLIDLADGPADGDHIITTSVPEDLDEFMRAMEEELARYRKQTPRLPLGIVWRAPIWEASGYGEESRSFIKGLSQGIRSLSIEPCNSVSQIATTSDDAALLRALERSRRPHSVVSVAHYIPTLCRPDPLAAYNVVRTTFETDSIPAEWTEPIDAFDEVWVTSNTCRDAVQRGGIAPEKIKVIGECVDTDRFATDGGRWQLDRALEGRFVFLSVFDWQLRKGWDVLLRSYAAEFGTLDQVGLLLKVTNWHGHSRAQMVAQADAVLGELGQSLAERPDIVFCHDQIAAADFPSLYRSADAFVLPSRGEGWGRGYMEAMACGLPVIATRGSAMEEYLDDATAFLVDATVAEVSAAACQEIPVYRGTYRPQRWWEPDPACLRRHMRRVLDDDHERNRIAAAGSRQIREHYSLACGAAWVEAAVQAIESRFQARSIPLPGDDQLRVELEGEVGAGHSFSNINEHLLRGLARDDSLAVALRRRRHNPTFDRRTPGLEQLLPYAERTFDDTDVTIRHAFPPNWEPPKRGKWVHIQPWEFGSLPKDWVAPLRDRVDEIWAPTEYVKEVYLRSGIAPAKVHVIPWGVDATVFHQDVPARILPTHKSFAFLFVGGTIARKGFDRALDAYLNEFGPDDDVCLVVKDMGAKSFYRDSNLRDQILEASNDPRKPEIVYLDQQMTSGQLASLYAACDCLVAPYRGEGFGLPVLEGMACGVPPIVPRSGATDDFVDESCAFLLPSRIVSSPLAWDLCGPATELELELDDVRRAMRLAFADRQRTAALGATGAAMAARFTWQKTVDHMVSRLNAIKGRTTDSAGGRRSSPQLPAPPAVKADTNASGLAVCVTTHNDETVLAGCLARIRPFVHELIVADRGSQDRTVGIAREYGAQVIDVGLQTSSGRILEQCLKHSASEWLISLTADDRLSEYDAEKLHTVVSNQPAGIVECSLVTNQSVVHRLHDHQTDRLVFKRRSPQNAQGLTDRSIATWQTAPVGQRCWTEATLLLLVAAHGKGDLAWLRNQNDFPYVVGEKLSADPICGVPVNKGAEASTFLKFIVNNYDDLPQYLCLLDDNESSWHQPFDMLERLRSLALVPGGTAFIPLNGLLVDTMHSAHHWSYACFQPVWDAVVKPHLAVDCPRRIVADGGARFIVSRDLVRHRRRELYTDLYEYTIGTKRWPGDEDWHDAIGYSYTPGGERGEAAGGAFFLEWIWHIVFGQDPILQLEHVPSCS